MYLLFKSLSSLDSHKLISFWIGLIILKDFYGHIGLVLVNEIASAAAIVLLLLVYNSYKAAAKKYDVL